jgi:hypothetical protein
LAIYFIFLEYPKTVNFSEIIFILNKKQNFILNEKFFEKLKMSNKNLIIVLIYKMQLEINHSPNYKYHLDSKPFEEIVEQLEMHIHI